MLKGEITNELSQDPPRFFFVSLLLFIYFLIERQVRLKQKKNDVEECV